MERVRWEVERRTRTRDVGLGDVLSNERLTGGAVGVERVALDAVAAGGSGRSVELDHPLAVL
ncbi:MAG TPA: hypothetical protein VHM94_16640 [Acidimicrobiia bacterium]|nr:hypothetical protein [Acidimicrobiia bacterium]